MNANVDLAYWKKEIEAARRRRDMNFTKWQQYATLHAKSYVVQKAENDDESVILPNGDQVRLSLVYSNIEQTLALLEVQEIGVKAKALDYTRAQDYGDTHREAIVEQALIMSSLQSGLIKGSEETDFIKRDALIIGHGVAFTWYRVEEYEEEVERIPLFTLDESGQLNPELDNETGEHILEPILEKKIAWAAVQDEHVPVLEFLFESTAKRMEKAGWHGREQVVKLAELRLDPRYKNNIPADIEAQAFRERDLYGWEQTDKDHLERDSVKKIVVWNRITKRLLTFLERVQTSGRRGSNVSTDLLLLGDEPWPVMFSHPDASPFNAFIPIPAQDSPWGISQIEHIRNAAEEADKIRTRQANATREQKTIHLIRKGLVDATEMSKALKSPDREYVEMNIPEDFNAGHDVLTLDIAPISSDLYKQEEHAREDVRMISGISEIPYGGASTATESENMMQVGGARPERKRNRYLAFLARVLGRHKDYLAAMGPDGQIVTVIGDDGKPVQLAYGREALQGLFDLTIYPGGGTMAASPVEQKAQLEFLNMVKGVSPEAFRLALREAGTMFGIRSIDAIVNAVPQAMQAPPGVDGRLRADMFSPEDYTNPQAVRAATNSRNES